VMSGEPLFTDGAENTQCLVVASPPLIPHAAHDADKEQDTNAEHRYNNNDVSRHLRH
jgi:hypothetical protein